MNLNELQPSEGSRVSRERKGRGRSAGNGKTSGRGQKGQKARSKTRLGFEGGQMPLYRRIPKRGFTNINRKKNVIVNLKTINDRFDDGSTITPKTLIEAGVIKNEKNIIKILGNGDISKKMTVKANKFSANATLAIEAAGGKIEVI